MQEKETLQKEIERTRKELDYALGIGTDVEAYYKISVKLDKLIERYIEISECEREKIEV